MKDKIQSFLKSKFSQYMLDVSEGDSNLPTFYVKLEGIVPVIDGLKQEPSLRFNYLNDLTAIDWLDKKSPRFEVCYILRSPSNKHSLVMLKVPVEDGEAVPSITGVFKGANWPEREVFDLMGIHFLNHPRMERILMPDNFQGHPLRKDYPLEGFGQDYLIADLLHIHQEDKQGG
jgi:NADH-quinone oxidoreductase subunit C